MAKPKNVDEYLQKLEGHFAYPILSKVRQIVHDTVPGIEEKIKWGSPSFEYKGLMMSMVAFKENAAVWFHKGALLDDPRALLEATSEDTKSMRKYRISSIDALDEEELVALVKEAVAKNESGEQVKDFNKPDGRYDRSTRLEQALSHNSRARETYEALTGYKKREYVEFIESAKQEATRQRRIEKSINLLEQGRGLNDQYRT